MNKKHFLSQSAYCVVNWTIVKAIGVNEALWLAEMISWDSHLDSHKRIDPEWFYYKQKYMEDKTGLSVQIQNRASNRLHAIGLIEKKRRGVPAINWYKINYEQIDSFCFQAPSSIKLIDLDLLKQQNLPYNSKNIPIMPAADGKNILSIKNIRPSYFRFAKQIQSKQIQSFPPYYRQFTPEQLKSQIDNGAKTIDLLVRLDNFEFESQIKPVIQWAIEDSFWKDQVKSLAPLRNKSSSNGETKFANIYSSWIKAEGIDPQKGRDAKMSDFFIRDSRGNVIQRKTT